MVLLNVLMGYIHYSVSICLQQPSHLLSRDLAQATNMLITTFSYHWSLQIK